MVREWYERESARQQSEALLASNGLVLLDFFGERDGIRTHDLLIKSQLLYRLSYALPRARKGRPRNCAEHRESAATGQPEKDGAVTVVSAIP